MKDYSFSEISQIVESNNAKILGAFLSNFDNELAEITVKINNTGFVGYYTDIYAIWL